jgi:uncharacterized protein YndB with AHSA1/START domain
MEPGKIERTASLPATREEVWAALTQPERLSDWFGSDVVELDVRPGGRLVFRDGDGIVRRALVEIVEPPALLSFRWLAMEEGADGRTRPAPAATVELRLTETSDGTDLTVVETPRILSRA